MMINLPETFVCQPAQTGHPDPTKHDHLRWDKNVIGMPNHGLESHP